MIYNEINSSNIDYSLEQMKIYDNQFTKTLGLAIEFERKKRRLTQTQLAELSNTSINFVSQVEAGKTTAQIGKVIDLIHILGLQLVIEKGSEGVVSHVR